MMGQDEGGPLFIVGFPRSGTTLMRALLSAHPTIAIAPETHFLKMFENRLNDHYPKTHEQFERVWTKFSQSDRFVDLGIDADATRESILATGDLRLKNIFALTLQKFARVAGKPRWGEKTPAHDRHIGTLLKWYPGARVIYLIRDPRAACASLLQAPWRTNPGSDAQGVKPDRMRRLGLLHDDSCSWRRNVDRYRRDWERDGRVMLVRYEDLASSPESALRTVCHFIGAEFDPGMLAPRSSDALPPVRAHLESKEHEEWRHAHIEKARQAVSTESVAKWKDQLTPLEVAVIETNCRPQMRVFGYDQVGSDDTLGRRWVSRLNRMMVSAFLHARKPFATPLA
ncbi:MAG: sulfotransferase [Gemmatimonadaceae bacterium]